MLHFFVAIANLNNADNYHFRLTREWVNEELKKLVDCLITDFLEPEKNALIAKSWSIDVTRKKSSFEMFVKAFSQSFFLSVSTKKCEHGIQRLCIISFSLHIPGFVALSHGQIQYNILLF